MAPKRPSFAGSRGKARAFINAKIKENFSKFLIDWEGRLLGRYGPLVPSTKISDLIQAIL